MNKSKYIFLLLCFSYIAIAVGGWLSYFAINNSVLFGLSLASLFTSLADAVNNVVTALKLNNNYNYNLKYTSNFLDGMIKSNYLYVKNMDICNIKMNIDLLITVKEPRHPNDYANLKRFRWCYNISNVFFFAGILCFVVTPFIKQGIETGNISSYITIFAFSIMCGNIYLTDCCNEINSNTTYFVNDKVSMIDLIFPGFLTSLTNEIAHKLSLDQNRHALNEIMNKIGTSSQEHSDSNASVGG